MEWVGYAKGGWISYSLSSKYLARDEYGLYVDGSYGDVVVTCALMHAFHDKYKQKVCLFIDQRYSKLVEAYREIWLRVVYLENPRALANALFKTGRMHFLEPGLIFPTLITQHPLLGEAVLSDRMRDIEARTLVLGLPPRSKLRPPMPNEDRCLDLTKALGALCFDKNNTILISLVTNTTSGLTLKDASVLIRGLATRGWQVALNVAGGQRFKELAPMVTLVEVPPDAPLLYSEYFLRHIVLASGLATVLSIFEHTASILHLIDNRGSQLVNNGVAISPERCSIHNGHWDLVGNRIEELYFDQIDDALIDQLNGWAVRESSNERKAE